LVTADDLSAEPCGALRWVLKNPDLAELGWTRSGWARRGLVWRGLVRAADGSTEGFTLPTVLSGTGLVRSDEVRSGEIW
jgi:hypothetical protein